MFSRMVLVLTCAVVAGLAQVPRGGPGGRFGAGSGSSYRVLGAFAGEMDRVVKNAPYSADVVTEHTQTLPDGNRVKQTATARVCRDSDGRVRNEQTVNGLGSFAPNVSLPRIVFINDPVAGVNYALNSADKTGTKSMGRSGPPREGGRGGRGGRGPRDMAPGGPPPSPPPSGSNVKSEILGKQTIEGVAAEGRRTTITIPAGQMGNERPFSIVTEVWYSPDLQVNLVSRHSDPMAGDTVLRLTNLSRTEPPAVLFQPPSDFKVTQTGRGSAPMAPQR
jgi:hypothetical protein